MGDKGLEREGGKEGFWKAVEARLTVNMDYTLMQWIDQSRNIPGSSCHYQGTAKEAGRSKKKRRELEKPDELDQTTWISDRTILVYIIWRWRRHETAIVVPSNQSKGWDRPVDGF